MTTQLTLFDPYHNQPAQPGPFQKSAMPGRPAPHSGGDTSREAAGTVRADAGRLRQAVLAFILGRGADGATDAEIQAALSLAGDTERPRRWELQRASLIADSGQRRRTRTGRKAVVWIAAPAHRAGADRSATTPKKTT